MGSDLYYRPTPAAEALMKVVIVRATLGCLKRSMSQYSLDVLEASHADIEICERLVDRIIRIMDGK